MNQNIQNLMYRRLDSYTEKENNLLKSQLEEDLKFMTCKEIEDYYGISDTKRKNLFRVLNVDKKPLWGVNKNLGQQSIISDLFEKENVRSIDIGNLIEAKVVAEAIKKGYNVFHPLFTGSSIDFIFEKDGNLFKIQVKSSESDERNSSLRVTKCNKDRITGKRLAYTEKEVDVFITYVSYIDKFLWIPRDYCKDKEWISLKINDYMSNNGIELEMIHKFVW